MMNNFQKENLMKIELKNKLSHFIVTKKGDVVFSGSYYAVLDYLQVDERTLNNKISLTQREESDYLKFEESIAKKIEKAKMENNEIRYHHLKETWQRYSEKNDPVQRALQVYVDREDEDWFAFDQELALVNADYKVSGRREDIEWLLCLVALSVGQNESLEDLSYRYSLNLTLLEKVNQNQNSFQEPVEMDEFFSAFLQV
jgi:uncharacterized protein YheU (UPF0270 family)